METERVLGADFFGPLWEYVKREEITDLDLNGSDLWVTDLMAGRYAVAGETLAAEGLTPSFLEQFVQRTANLVSRQFNKRYPVLEAETEELRLTILHESAARSGRCISIRKTPACLRLTPETAVRDGYCDEETLAFLANCVRVHRNLIFCGLPGAGKTESLKLFASYIPPQERVITIEDTMEIHYSRICPQADSVEMKVNEEIFDYTDAIKASLRMNPSWIMLSEARSREVRYLLESWSTGVHGMTTIHTGDVRNVPDRILNMFGNHQEAKRLENEIYRTVDAAILVKAEAADGGGFHRSIRQIGLFQREGGTNQLLIVYEDGVWKKELLPDALRRSMMEAGIRDPFRLERLREKRMKEERTQNEQESDAVSV